MNISLYMCAMTETDTRKRLWRYSGGRDHDGGDVGYGDTDLYTFQVQCQTTQHASHSYKC